MTTTPAETVLCSRREDLPTAWLPEAGALALAEAEVFAVLDRTQPVWLPRAVAEADSQHLQWIPYVLLRRPDGRFAAYRRRGVETRLHGCWSLGVGGHVHPEDGIRGAEGSIPGWRSSMLGGMQRELAEEFPGAVPGGHRFLGLVHESRSAVGQVHIGAVFLHETGPDPGEPGPELHDLTWVEASALVDGGDLKPRLELWSQLALGLLPSSLSP